MAYACMDLRELALPGGFLLLLLSAAAQLPFFIFLCNYLDGDTTIGMKVWLHLAAVAPGYCWEGCCQSLDSQTTSLSLNIAELNSSNILQTKATVQQHGPYNPASAAAHLPAQPHVLLQEILLPQIASWSAMWLSGLIICYGLRKKEQLRARLATSGQVWTAHETAARELMSLELEDMQQQVDKMSNEELAQVAMRMMEVSSRPGG